MNSVRSDNLRLKCENSLPSGCKDIGIRKLEFVAKAPFYDGVSTLHDGVRTLHDGVRTLHDGVRTLHVHYVQYVQYVHFVHYMQKWYFIL